MRNLTYPFIHKKWFILVFVAHLVNVIINEAVRGFAQIGFVENMTLDQNIASATDF